MDSLCSIFLWFMESTIAASVVILLVMTVQKLFRRQLSARLLHVLWLIVLVRLLVPVFPNSPVSIFHLFQLGSGMTQAVITSNPFIDNQLLQQLAVDDGERLFLQTPANGLLSENQPMPANMSSHGNGAAVAVHTYSAGLQIISVVWLAGVVTLMLYLAGCLCKMNLRRRAYKLVTDSLIVSVFNECRKKFGINKEIPLYTGRNAKSPYISGLIRPWIYIPEGLDKELSPIQLSHVFSHEMAHLKRKDMMWNLLGSFVLAIHWLNPLVWICMKQMKADGELACDAYTLEVLGEAEAVPYGMTIIQCLKGFASKPQQPNLLYFYEANNQNQMERRIGMIKIFKKGSYKLSVLAAIGVIILGAATLTNAGSSTVTASSSKEDQQAGQAAIEEDQILFDSPFRTYGTLEKAVKVANFKYKLPESLPEGYQFDDIHYVRAETDHKQGSNVSVRFEKREGNTSYGSFTFSAILGGAGLEAAYAGIEQEESERGAKIKKDTFKLPGMDGLKVTVSKNNWEDLYYIWQDQGIQYQIKGNAELKSKDMETMIASMKYPDQKMFERYINHDLLIEYIYDTGDLQQVPESIGFSPKFPLQLPGGFQATTAFETRKVNFSHPENEADRWARLLYISYKKTDQDESGVSRFSFKQIKNNNIYENIKQNGNIAFSQIDGVAHLVEVKPIEIGGREVLVTAKYKIDGVLSGPSDPDYTSYFWIENDVCFQVTFNDEGPEQKEIVRHLMNEKFVDVNTLN